MNANQNPAEEALARLTSAILAAAHGGWDKADELDAAIKNADRVLRDAGYVPDGITGETYFKETT